MRRLLLTAILAVAMALGIAAPASARSLSVPAVDVDAVLNPDASMDVTETVTYRLDGAFNEGFRSIPRGDYSITAVSVSENGQPLPASVRPDEIAWPLNQRDGERTFVLRYTVLGAAKVGPDVGELYWKWVGEDHPGLGRLRVFLAVPGEGGVRAWAHGPLNGTVTIQAGGVRFEVEDVPAATFVEGRVTVPAAAFTVPPSGEPRLPAILAEEQRFADEANAERDRIASRRRLGNAGAPVAGVLAFVAAAAIWWRKGKEHEPERDPGPYLRDLPDDPPAVVNALARFGGVEAVGFGATIVDLAQRGYLTITEEHEERWGPDKRDWHFTRTGEPDVALLDHERRALDIVFRKGDQTSQSAIEKWSRDHVKTAQKAWKGYTKAVKAEFDRRGYVEGGKGGATALIVLLAAVALGAGVLALSVGAPGGIAGIVLGVLTLGVLAGISRRTHAGAQRHAEWQAVRRFLKDFSQLGDAPAGHLVLYERYLVYAVTLGVSDELAKGLALHVPEVVDDPTFAPWWHGSRMGPGRFGSFAAFAPSAGGGIASASTPRSSGSGSGGGFSGGGGGGGGGGGFGAR